MKLGLKSYWDVAYADDLAKFREHGHTGDVLCVLFILFFVYFISLSLILQKIDY